MRIRIKKFQALSGFKIKILQLVRFQINFFTTRQILKQIFHNVSDFVLVFFKKSDLEQKCACKKAQFDSNYVIKWRILLLLCFFKQHDSDEKNFFKKQGFNKKIRVRFYFKNFKKCKKLKQKFQNMSDFKTKALQHASFWNEIIKTRTNLCKINSF